MAICNECFMDDEVVRKAIKQADAGRWLFFSVSGILGIGYLLGIASTILLLGVGFCTRTGKREGMMDERYVQECRSFMWLQENKRATESGKPNNGLEYVDGKMVYCPRLDTLIELMGDRFVSLHYVIKSPLPYEVFVFTDDALVGCESVYAKTKELACLMALKKIKGE